MTITDIYKKFKINKGLQEHMIRVAAVAKMVCDESTLEVDTENIVTACLLHDMGNLVKFNLNSSEEEKFLEPEGLEYWKQVQNEVIEKYGSDDHSVTEKMVEEIGVNEKVKLYLNAFDYYKNSEYIGQEDSLAIKIAAYSDNRAGLYGVVNLKERIDDIRERYLNRTKNSKSVSEIDIREARIISIEKDIFENSNIQPEDITDESTKEIQKELWEYSLG